MNLVQPALALVMLVGSGAAPFQPSPVAGVWRFEKEVDTRADGSVVTVGPEHGYEGLLILTSDGFMSGTLMPRGRRWAVESASLPELRETAVMGTAYSGRYRVDVNTRTVTIDVVTSLDPSDVGKSLTRHYSLEKGVLQLSGTWVYAGETLGFTITFSRVR